MNWRLIHDGAACGAWNMAVDEALLLSYDGMPTLRFYDWNPACLSIGRFQEYSGAWNSEEFRAWNFDVVRRPTGGRAVLHQHEITYCVVIGEELLPPDQRSVIGSYRWLSAAFIDGLRELGIEAALARSEYSGGSTPGTTNCFSAAALCDFLVEDKKLIGAAQCRKNKVILQHGSLLLDINDAAWQAAVGGSMKEAVSLHTLGIITNRTRTIEALCEGVERTFNVRLERHQLHTGEEQLATQLHQQKYSGSGWTKMGR